MGSSINSSLHRTPGRGEQLFKHCRPQHLPGMGKTIRIGTLSEYRSNENQAVRDKDEGLFRVSLKLGDGLPISQSWLRNATLDTLQISWNSNNIEISNSVGLFEGRYSSGVISCDHDFEIQGWNGPELRLTGNVNLKLEAADAFVFCLSSNGLSGSVVNDASYSGRWSVLVDNVLLFKACLAEEIRKEIGAGRGVTRTAIGPDFSSLPHPLFDLPDLERTHLFLAHSVFTVKYKRKLIELKSVENDLPNDLRVLLDESTFTKPIEFKQEEEVRLVFRLGYRFGENCFWLPYKYEPIFVPSEAILPLICIHGLSS